MTSIAQPEAFSALIGRPIDNTALADFMVCPKKYQYGYVLHRRREGPPPPAISYGSVWHRAMEVHYRTGGNMEAVIAAMREAWEPHDRPDDHRTLERAQREYLNYVAKYNLPGVEEAKTVGFPEQPMVEIAVELTWPGARHPYAGKIDRIIEWHGNYYVEDHKTTSQMGSNYFQQFELSNQMMGYAWLAQLVSGKPIAGVRINAHAIYKAQSSKFERHVVSFSRERLEEWAENYNGWVERIEYSAKLNDWPRNFNACAGKYGMCQYAGVCSSSPRIRDQVLTMDFAERPWDPMKAADDATGE